MYNPLTTLPHLKKLGKPVATIVLLCVLVTTLHYISTQSWLSRNSSLLSQTQPSDSSETSYDENRPPLLGAPVAARYKHPIMVLQHDCQCKGQQLTSAEQYNTLASVSEQQHREWAEAHGYVYRLSKGQYVPQTGWGGTGYMNKVFLTLQVMLQELEREDTVEWIILTDVDQIIVDPSIAPHYMLPPEEKDALLIITEDFQGFNSGTIFYKVSHHAATFLARVIDLEHSAVDPQSDTQAPGEGAFYASDQRAIGLAIQRFKDVAERTYFMPQDWFNSYEYPPNDPGVHDVGSKEEKEVYKEWLEVDRIQLQAHMAGGAKRGLVWQGWPVLADKVYQEARMRAEANGIPGNGLDLLSTKAKAEQAAREWWTSTTPGVEGLVVNAF